ncbi:excalibur calcium-binding domain-containing protein [Agrococcus sp. SGAir0287]|uniref:excalibur calcium-binding domain-containing protein n=1 Tax=Agrococcus sp. SGAir0287 TaxID=2070347 RepID=UPI0020C7E48C|nr:excalibur calcium-binding domain-containing protein [Agrococcus sp. SGAir0287]
MDERAMGWMPDRAEAAQDWAQQRAQSLPWARGEQRVPNPMAPAPGPTVPVPNPTAAMPMPGGVPVPTAPIPQRSPGAVPNPMAFAGAPGGGHPFDGGGRAKRRWPRVLLIGAGALTLFALGSCAGGLGQAGEVQSLQSELATTTTELAGAIAESDELQLLVDEQAEDVLAAEDEVDELASTLTSVEAELATAQTDLAAAQSTVAERDATIASLQAELATAQAAAAAPAPAPVAAVPQAAAPAAPVAPSNVYYQNCTAARQAGAAPVYAGQPGYGPHLDRDGDGVGCES